jgi:hypothetical protein
VKRFAEALTWLEGRVEAETRRLRARYELSLDELRGLFISDAMVDALLSGGAPPAGFPPACASLDDLVGHLELGAPAQAALLILLAPELDARYATLYAYLNDDVSRRWATPDLVGRLAGAPAESLFAPASPIVRLGLAVAGDPADRGKPLRLRCWRASPALIHRALGLTGQHAAWLKELQAGPSSAAASLRPPWPALLVSGPDGSGRAALAAGHAASAGLRALLFDAAAAGEERPTLLSEAATAARLDRAMLIVAADGVDPFGCPPEDIPLAIIVQAAGAWPGALRSRLVLSLSANPPDASARAACWRVALRDLDISAPRGVVKATAARFRLTPSAIARAARRAAILSDERPIAGRLFEGARAEAAVDPGALARRIAPSCGWEDLVLPDGALRQLRDFTSAIDRRVQVFEDWGFGSVGRATGSGLAALFSGGSGTGKTMSASVVAASVGLDLWKIDLSAMVSKYIGETEKNLERLFTSAEAGDSILFFDEADAIFGKRSEVRDSHDRYSNIEIAYLLQRIEQFEGIVILATNVSRNLDAAFLRRVPFVIDFPLPGPAARARLWRKAIPERAPLAAGVDFAVLGARFEMSGGDIRSAALEAGFLAAGNGGVIDDHALRIAVTRQLLKRGQLPEGSREGGRPARAPQ